jgi:HEPN domain-containing protein
MALTQQEVIQWVKHLQKESKEAYTTATDLYKSKRYHFALFFCHLAVEKIIKAYHLLKHRVFALPIHDLILLIKKSGFKTDEKNLEQLVEINTFNIKARYEDYKREFYKKATSGYAKEWIEITSDLLKLMSKNP